MEQILKEDQAMPRKQRHTAKRLWERLKEEGFTGGYTIVKDTVREMTAHRQEVFMPLIHRPGEAQVDCGEALVNLNGKLRKVHFFVMALPYSDASFVMAFERECTETFWEGHVQAFEFFGGVGKRISYDNTKIAVAKIIGGGKDRRLTRGFCQLKSHYLFDHHFCRPARGNEKGVVEGQVKFTRLNFFVPVPQVRDFTELNARLRQQCVEDRERRLRGQAGTKAELLPGDQAAFLSLPATAFAAILKKRAERYASPDKGKETRADLSAAEKVQVLRNNLASRNNIGAFDGKGKLHHQVVDYNNRTLDAAYQFFLANPDFTVADLNMILEKGLILPEQPANQEGNNPLWHARRAKDITFLIHHLDIIVKSLDCVDEIAQFHPVPADQLFKKSKSAPRDETE
jgi:transposase